MKISEDEDELKTIEKKETKLNSMFLESIEEHEIITIVKNFSSKTSRDWNGIDMVLLKKVVMEIVKPLCYILNLSFQSGVFPKDMKIAKVVLLFKKGETFCFNNYCPMSILSQFAKILEKAFCLRCDSFFEKHDLLVECQYGFRTGRSTTLALLDLVEYIIQNMDKGKSVERYGVRGIVSALLKSYIEGRKQFVYVNEFSSELLNIKCGVPQGSILGPKLFLMYINDICGISKKAKMVTYADDTNIIFPGENLHQTKEVVTQEMLKNKKWCALNKLSLNLDKTKFMVFGNSKKTTNVLVQIEIVELEEVKEIKFLGVILDKRVSWKSHIKYVRSKLLRCLAILVKKHALTLKALQTLYNALFLPYLSTEKNLLLN